MNNEAWTAEIVGLVAAIVVAVLVRIINMYFPDVKDQLKHTSKHAKNSYDGTMTIIETGTKKTYSLNLDIDPDEMDDMEMVRFKVQHPIKSDEPIELEEELDTEEYDEPTDSEE